MIALLGVGALLVGAVLVISPGVGSRFRETGLSAAWSSFFTSAEDRTPSEETAYFIGFRIRFARTVLALHVGVTLALCGAVLQTLFRNSLATPYTLGVASGGALGALIAIQAGWSFVVVGLSSVTLCAFGGALAVIGVVVLLTRGRRRLTTNELLLAGVTMGLFCSAASMLVIYIAEVRETFEAVRWMMGSLDAIGNVRSAMILPLTLPAWIVFIAYARGLNQFVLGEEMAQARGVNVRRMQIVCVLAASLATAAVVSLCGPIGFVGLVVPHMTALVVGRDQRILLPASAMVGGVFLALCDWGSQVAMGFVGAMTGREMSMVVMPIGVVTAVVGVPIFLVLLYRRAA
jgi:iron complex transport system permease protein